MWNLIFGLVFAGVVSAMAWAAWNHFTGSYIAQGAAEQKALDQKVVNLAEARAVRAETDAARAASASKVQSEAILLEQQRADEAQRETRVIGDAYAKVVKSSEARIAGLKQAAAADPVTGRSCAETLELADRILRDSLRVRSTR
jgi:hypothetical protein